MLPEFFDHAQAENVGYLCVHRETGGQDVSILTQAQKEILKSKSERSHRPPEILTVACGGSSCAKPEAPAMHLP